MTVIPRSIEMIELVALALGELNQKSVFVGGATLPFYLPEVYWSQASPTEDVDVVMEITGRVENGQTDEILRAKGFTNDTTKGAPICRWIYKGIKVDFMSPDESIFGFANHWYKEGIEKSIVLQLGTITVRIFSGPYFLATKIEAFKQRGNKDYQASKDMEDILAVLEVSEKDRLLDQMQDTSIHLREYLKEELSILQRSENFLDAIPGSLFNRINTREGVAIVLKRIEDLVNSGD